VIVERLPSYVSARQKQEKKSSPSTRRNCARVVFADRVDFLDAASCFRSRGKNAPHLML
jgi:hypothetical protein